MTAIACRDGIMAADSGGWTADSHVITPVSPKIRVTEHGLVACAGETDEIEDFHTWFLAGMPAYAKPEKGGGIGALWLRHDGTIWFAGARLRFVQCAGPFWAIGASERFLWGALHAGATAEQAVRLAIQHTDGAAGDVQVERLEA